MMNFISLLGHDFWHRAKAKIKPRLSEGPDLNLLLIKPCKEAFLLKLSGWRVHAKKYPCGLWTAEVGTFKPTFLNSLIQKKCKWESPYYLFNAVFIRSLLLQLFSFSLLCVFQLKLNAATRCFDINKHENEIVLVSFFPNCT